MAKQIQNLFDIVHGISGQVQLEGLNFTELCQLCDTAENSTVRTICDLASGNEDSYESFDVRESTKETAKLGVELAEYLMRSYEGKTLTMLEHVTSCLRHIPEAQRRAYMGSIRDLAAQEDNGQNKNYVMPELVGFLRKRFVEDHQVILENRTEDNPRYLAQVAELQKDIDKFLVYAEDAVAKNVFYGLQGGVSYDACFGEAAGANAAEGDEEPIIFGSEFILGAIGNGGIAHVTDNFGKPQAIAHRGISSQPGITIKLWFQDHGEVAIEHSKGLNPKDLAFYQAMAASIERPLDGMGPQIRKTRDFLVSYRK